MSEAKQNITNFGDDELGRQLNDATAVLRLDIALQHFASPLDALDAFLDAELAKPAQPLSPNRSSTSSDSTADTSTPKGSDLHLASKPIEEIEAPLSPALSVQPSDEDIALFKQYIQHGEILLSTLQTAFDYLKETPKETLKTTLTEEEVQDLRNARTLSKILSSIVYTSDGKPHSFASLHDTLSSLTKAEIKHFFRPIRTLKKSHYPVIDPKLFAGNLLLPNLPKQTQDPINTTQTFRTSQRIGFRSEQSKQEYAEKTKTHFRTLRREMSGMVSLDKINNAEKTALESAQKGTPHKDTQPTILFTRTLKSMINALYNIGVFQEPLHAHSSKPAPEKKMVTPSKTPAPSVLPRSRRREKLVIPTSSHKAFSAAVASSSNNLARKSSTLVPPISITPSPSSDQTEQITPRNIALNPDDLRLAGHAAAEKIANILGKLSNPSAQEIELQRLFSLLGKPFTDNSNPLAKKTADRKPLIALLKAIASPELSFIHPTTHETIAIRPILHKAIADAYSTKLNQFSENSSAAKNFANELLNQFKFIILEPKVGKCLTDTECSTYLSQASYTGKSPRDTSHTHRVRSSSANASPYLATPSSSDSHSSRVRANSTNTPTSTHLAPPQDSHTQKASSPRNNATPPL